MAIRPKFSLGPVTRTPPQPFNSLFLNSSDYPPLKFALATPLKLMQIKVVRLYFLHCNPHNPCCNCIFAKVYETTCILSKIYAKSSLFPWTIFGFYVTSELENKSKKMSLTLFKPYKPFLFQKGFSRNGLCSFFWVLGPKFLVAGSTYSIAAQGLC